MPMWKRYDPCKTCGAEKGCACKDTRVSKTVPKHKSDRAHGGRTQNNKKNPQCISIYPRNGLQCTQLHLHEGKHVNGIYSW